METKEFLSKKRPHSSAGIFAVFLLFLSACQVQGENGSSEGGAQEGDTSASGRRFAVQGDDDPSAEEDSERNAVGNPGGGNGRRPPRVAGGDPGQNGADDDLNSDREEGQGVAVGQVDHRSPRAADNCTGPNREGCSPPRSDSSSDGNNEAGGMGFVNFNPYVPLLDPESYARVLRVELSSSLLDDLHSIRLRLRYCSKSVPFKDFIPIWGYPESCGVVELENARQMDRYVIKQASLTEREQIAISKLHFYRFEFYRLPQQTNLRLDNLKYLKVKVSTVPLTDAQLNRSEGLTPLYLGYIGKNFSFSNHEAVHMTSRSELCVGGGVPDFAETSGGDVNSTGNIEFRFRNTRGGNPLVLPRKQFAEGLEILRTCQWNIRDAEFRELDLQRIQVGYQFTEGPARMNARIYFVQPGSEDYIQYGIPSEVIFGTADRPRLGTRYVLPSGGNTESAFMEFGRVVDPQRDPPTQIHWDFWPSDD